MFIAKIYGILNLGWYSKTSHQHLRSFFRMTFTAHDSVQICGFFTISSENIEIFLWNDLFVGIFQNTSLTINPNVNQAEIFVHYTK